MKRPVEILRGANFAVRSQFVALTGQSERSLLLGTVLLVTAVSAVTGFVLAQYYAIDVLSSLIFVPQDCYLDWGMNVGRHCFSDYTMPVTLGLRPNPWEPYPAWTSADHVPFQNNYPPAGMLPHVTFGLLGQWLHAPRVGLIGYLLALAVAVFSPAIWAARGTRGYDRLVVLIACGMAAIPAWMVIDRGNSVGFAVPIALVFLVALSRGQWRLVSIMVILAALVKPQFVLLAVVLFAARRWRWGGIAVGGAVILNFAAYAFWPHNFPGTIAQSMRATLESGAFQRLVGAQNVSFSKAVLLIPDSVAKLKSGGLVPEGFLIGLRSLVGYVALVLVIAILVAVGRRVSPVMAGIVMLATASLFPALTQPYYLVFVLPVAALVVRDPDGPPGSGIFDRAATVGGRRRAAGIWVSLAAALSIAQIALPGPSSSVPIVGQLGSPGIAVMTAPMVATTLSLTPVLWLIACAAIVVSYTRKPAFWPLNHQEPKSAAREPETHPNTAAGGAPPQGKQMVES